MITAEQLKVMYKSSPVEVSKSLAESLRDFGYPITDEWVQEEISKLLKGDESAGGPSMFLARWLKDGVD